MKQPTVHQQATMIPVLTQVLIEFMEASKDEFPAVFSFGLKKAANNMIAECEKLNQFIYGPFDRSPEG